MALQHDSPTPLYIQLKEYLQMQIQTGEYAVDARLPSERELAKLHHVSRMTARQALQALAQEGFTYTRVGKGTFVNAPRIDQELHALTSFSEDMQGRGMSASSRVLKASSQAADRDTANHLRIEPGTEVVVLRRVRLADGEPLALETAHLPHHLCPDILSKHDFSTESLYAVLRSIYGWVLVWADQLIQARLPGEAECDVLAIGAQMPVLAITRVTFAEGDRPVEFVRSVYRGDQYQLHAVLISDLDRNSTVTE